ncbi:MAG: DMT family transporter [Candidatus Obscuribacterales bacterium]|nr:DMT family transporter [Candidatus Obscuribacterales bacterium]
MSTAKEQSGNYFWITATLLAASIEPIIAKIGYAANCTPLQLLCLKSIVGALVIYPLTRKESWLAASELKTIIPAALLLLCTSTLSLSALQFIPASLLITILTVTPAVVALVNQALGRDTLSKKFWLGFFTCVLGLLFTLKSEFAGIHALGIGLALAAVCSSSTYRVLMERITSCYKPAIVSRYIFLINGACSLSLVPFVFQNGLPGNLLLSGLWLGTAAAVANLAFLYAISILGATRVSIISMLERPIVILIAAIVLKEALSPAQILGIILVFSGVQIAKVKRNQKTQEAKVATLTASTGSLSR